jgi:putative membrane protein
MRFFQATLLIAFLAAVAIFALQNNAPTQLRFLVWAFTAPQAVIIVGVYLLGMISGGAVFGFIRRSLRVVSEQPRSTDR